MSLKDTLRINRLYEIYGKLLTKQQQEIMEDYYQANLSLSEISEIRNISRTAVSDALKVAVKKLENYEEKIRICGVFDEIKNTENANLLDEIEEKLRNGI